MTGGVDLCPGQCATLRWAKNDAGSIFADLPNLPKRAASWGYLAERYILRGRDAKSPASVRDSSSMAPRRRLTRLYVTFVNAPSAWPPRRESQRVFAASREPRDGIGSRTLAFV